MPGSSAPGPRTACRFYWATGRCRYGASCRFAHEQRPGSQPPPYACRRTAGADERRLSTSTGRPRAARRQGVTAAAVAVAVTGTSGARGDGVVAPRTRPQLPAQAAQLERGPAYRGELPGYLYDAAKDKYFRSQTGGPPEPGLTPLTQLFPPASPVSAKSVDVRWPAGPRLLHLQRQTGRLTAGSYREAGHRWLLRQLYTSTPFDPTGAGAVCESLVARPLVSPEHCTHFGGHLSFENRACSVAANATGTVLLEATVAGRLYLTHITTRRRVSSVPSGDV